MLKTPSQQLLQNNYFWKYPRLQSFQVYFIHDLEGKGVQRARHNYPKNIILTI